jgi:putative ABC transport system permease protein
LLLRDQNNVRIRKLDPTKWIFAIFTISGILGIAIWQAGSWKVGTFFLVGLAFTSAILYAVASLLTRSLKGMKKFSTFSVSQAVNSLYRPGNQTRVVLLAVGLGAFVVIAVQSLQLNLVRELDFTRNETLPSLFLVDIQRSQAEAVRKMSETAAGEPLTAIPTVRMRIARVDGAAIDYSEREVRQQQGQIGREFAVTYRPQLEENEKIIAGKWWEPTKSAEPEVSVVDDMARRLKINIGSTITFDVLGRIVNAKVTSVRKIDVRNTRTVFVFVFRPGTLENAPQTFAIPIVKQIPAVERARFQRSVIDAYPNVQIFDVQDILTTVTKLVNNFVLAISFVGSFVMLTGILILIGSVSLTKSQRVYENAVLKTLGAGRGKLFTILVIEYVILGLLAGLIGAVFAMALSYSVTKYVLEFNWEFDAMLVIAGILITALFVTVIGTVASFDVLFKKPLGILRSQ